MIVVEPLEYRQLRAPRDDGQSLIAPPLAEVGELLAGEDSARAVSPRSDVDLQGRTLRELSRAARRDLVGRALAATKTYRDVDVPDTDRILLAGHQPQLFHPGVWLKNFVLAQLGARHQAVPINLLIDSDTLKSTAVAVPGGPPSNPIVRHVSIDAAADSIPYEERAIADGEILAGFDRRVQEHLGSLVPHPLLEEYWPLVRARAAEEHNLGRCLAQSRHQLEGRWGYQTLELPFSEVCQSEPFAWFVAHLLAHLPRWWEVYNDSLAEYRRHHGLRSASHPVPDLAADDDWLEAPFWVWSRSDPRRRALFARLAGDEIEISDRAGFSQRLSLTPEGSADRAAEMLHGLAARGIKLRTRALTTTLWARLALGDLFIHGLGGAIYDQVTDALIERFFGLRPPPYLTVTGTLLLPIARPAATEEDLRSIDQKLRELHFNPERTLRMGDSLAANRPAQELARAKLAWIARGEERTLLAERHRELLRLTDALRPYVADEREQLLARRREVEQQLRAARILGSREYAWCLYPAEKIRGWLAGS